MVHRRVTKTKPPRPAYMDEAHAREEDFSTGRPAGDRYRPLTAGETKLNAGAVARGTLAQVPKEVVDVAAIRKLGEAFALEHALELAYETQDGVRFTPRPILNELTNILRPIGPYAFPTAKAMAQNAIIQAFIVVSELMLDPPKEK